MEAPYDKHPDTNVQVLKKAQVLTANRAAEYATRNTDAGPHFKKMQRMQGKFLLATAALVKTDVIDYDTQHHTYQAAAIKDITASAQPLPTSAPPPSPGPGTPIGSIKNPSRMLGQTGAPPPKRITAEVLALRRAKWRALIDTERTTILLKAREHRTAQWEGLADSEREARRLNKAKQSTALAATPAAIARRLANKARMTDGQRAASLLNTAKQRVANEVNT
jgi:hypothetical protein